MLAPLILGIAGIIAFLWIERSFVRHPTVPFDILKSRTTLLGYATTFLHSVVMMMIVYVLHPVSCDGSRQLTPHSTSTKATSCRPRTSKRRGNSHLSVPGRRSSPSACESGVCLSSGGANAPLTAPPCSTVAPFAILTGAWVTITQKYKLQNIVGWLFVCIGSGLLILLRWDSSKALWAGLYVSALHPARLPVGRFADGENVEHLDLSWSASVSVSSIPALSLRCSLRSPRISRLTL